MDGFGIRLDEFKALNTRVVAATAESEAKASEMAAKMQGPLSLPLAFGVTRAQADTLGAWWEDRRQIVQPAAFVLNAQRLVLSATYSTGPIGRLDAEDALRFIRFQEKQQQGG